LLRSIPKTVNRDVTEGGEAVETEVEEKKEVEVKVEKYRIIEYMNT